MKTIRVLILQSAGGPGLPEGVVKKGAEIDLDETVAQSLIDCGVARRIEAKKGADVRETATPPAIENREKRKK